jgi:hypothetical protein
MSRIVSLFAVALLGASPVATAQLKMPHPQQPGASIESAVRLVVTSDLMIDRSIRRWLRQHYPGWDADPHEIREFGDERYAVVQISAQNQPDRRVYFRLAGHQKEYDDLPPL